KFFALAEWCAQRFESCDLVVSDTLQRYNLAAWTGGDLGAALTLSRIAGDAWLDRHRATIAAISSARIVRWDDCLARSEYGPGRAKLGQLYEEDDHVRSAIDRTVAAYHARSGVVQTADTFQSSR